VKLLQEDPELSRNEAIAKLKSAIVGDTCQARLHETDHNREVVDCTISEMQKHLTSEELSYPHIKEKISDLEQGAEVFKGTPIKKKRMSSTRYFQR
jgi:hypothetical protein